MRKRKRTTEERELEDWILTATTKGGIACYGDGEWWNGGIVGRVKKKRKRRGRMKIDLCFWSNSIKVSISGFFLHFDPL